MFRHARAQLTRTARHQPPSLRALASSRPPGTVCKSTTSTSCGPQNPRPAGIKWPVRCSRTWGLASHLGRRLAIGRPFNAHHVIVGVLLRGHDEELRDGHIRAPFCRSRPLRCEGARMLIVRGASPVLSALFGVKDVACAVCAELLFRRDWCGLQDRGRRCINRSGALHDEWAPRQENCVGPLEHMSAWRLERGRR
jgi:hypothetical protein